MPTYGLQFSDIYTRIKDYANINNLVDADTKAKRAANDAIRLIASMRNWEALKREAAITPTASTQAYSLAADFDHIISCWYISNGLRVPIEVVDDDRWNYESDNDTDGNPEICRVTNVGGSLQIQFSPRPSGSFISLYTNIPYDYVKKPTELSADENIPDIPDTSQQLAIVYYAVSDILGKQGDIEGMSSWELKGERILSAAHKIDDKKEGRHGRLGKPAIPINHIRGTRISDYRER